MDDLLKALLPKEKSEVKKIWNSAIFVLDANVILNLYKYSNSTRNELLHIFESINEYLWIPHQVALEYLYNRNTKINEQSKEFDTHVNAISKAKREANKVINKEINSIRKSFRKIDIKQLNEKIDNFFTELQEDIKQKNEDIPNFKNDDMVLKSFKQLFEDRIGDAYSQEKLDDIYDEGKKRYENLQPPGYEDLKEKEGQYKLYADTYIKSEFGDLIIWHQIMDKSVTSNKPIIFITDDNKEDWKREEHGEFLGPRLELINEFKQNTEQEFLMYSTEYFLRMAKKMLNLEVDVTKTTIDEVHESNRKENKTIFNNIDKDLLKDVINYKHRNNQISNNKSDIVLPADEIVLDETTKRKIKKELIKTQKCIKEKDLEIEITNKHIFELKQQLHFERETDEDKNIIDLYMFELKTKNEMLDYLKNSLEEEINKMKQLESILALFDE
jgi:hypothetical protein